MANGIEYWLHRYPMHHRMRLMPVVCEHVTIHHNFTLTSISISSSLRTIMRRFCRIIFCGAVFGNCSDSGVVGFVFGADRGWQFALVGYSYYLLYEALHFPTILGQVAC